MSEDWKLQVSFKLGQDMINIRAKTGDELSVLLENISELTSQIIATQRVLGAGTAIAPLSTQNSTVTPGPVAYSQPHQAQVPLDTAPTCIHGPRKRLTGISKKTNNPYDFWACSAPQFATDKCAPMNPQSK